MDLKGNLVNKDGNLVDKDGNELYAFKINGATIGNYGKGTTLSTIISDINSNNDHGLAHVGINDQIGVGLGLELQLHTIGELVAVIIRGGGLIGQFDPSKDMIDNNLSASEKAAKLGEMIEKKLDDAKVTLSSGETKAASELIDVEVKGGQITFKDKTTGGNNVSRCGRWRSPCPCWLPWWRS